LKSHIIGNGVAESPRSLTVRRTNEKLLCSAEGYHSSVRLRWTELNADSKTYSGDKLNICHTVSFQHLKQDAPTNLTDLEFQCAASDDQRSGMTNYTVHTSEMDEIFNLCAGTLQPPGNRGISKTKRQKDKKLFQKLHFDRLISVFSMSIFVFT
jgi:hypothetical protein